MAAARELGRLSLPDALALCVLLAEKELRGVAHVLESSATRLKKACLALVLMPQLVGGD
jgi:hypothetical protein